MVNSSPHSRSAAARLFQNIRGFSARLAHRLHARGARCLRHWPLRWRRSLSAVPIWAQSRAKRLSRVRISLQGQLGILLTLMSLVFVIGSYLIHSLVIMPTFASLEREHSVQNINRCLAGLNRELELLADLTNDWAAWDETYRFIQDRNEAFRESSLNMETCQSARLSLLALVTNDGELVWGNCYDLGSMEPVAMPGLWPLLSSQSFPLRKHRHLKDARGGILSTAAGTLLLYASPIITSKLTGPIRGSIIMGRFLGTKEIEALGRRCQVDLAAWPVGRSPVPNGEAEILETLRETGGPLLLEESSRTLTAFTACDDIFGRPALLLRAQTPRQITVHGRLAGIVAVGGSILGSLIVMLGAGMLVRHRVVAPLEAMAAHAHRVGGESDFRARLDSRRTDEIGQVSHAFDSMVENLAVSRRKVMERAHKAGMADVASEVLHNVGNVINSANASVEQLEEQLRYSKVDGLEKAAGLLQENSTHAAEFFSQDPRGPKLVSYLVKISSVLHTERLENQERVTRIRKSIRHIQEIVATQEHRAHHAGFSCETDLDSTFREVVALNRDRLERAGIQVQVRLEPLPEMVLNGSKLAQVLINLVRNAIQAMEGIPEAGRVLTLAAREIPGDGFEIEVTDTGTGLTEEVQANLFQHGFTTKEHGQGIGLHYCANAVRSMGGVISARSDGPGQGATFSIRFPASVAAVPPWQGRSAKAA